MPTFDGINLIMTLDAPTSGVLTNDVEVDWYNAWKNWMLSSTVNRKYPPVFEDSFGGNNLTPGIDAGAYFIFRNDYGWRIRPYEADQTIYVAGNVAPANSLLPIMVPTIGGYTVLLDGLQPVTQNVDTILESQEASTLSTQRLIESLRPHHSGFGDIYYWSPYDGDDTNDGTLPTTATKTFAQAQTLATDNHNDIIICLANDPIGITTTTEYCVVTKSNLYIRGPGREFIITSANDAQDSVHIIGDGVELSSLQISTSPTNAEWGVHTVGDFTLLKDLYVAGCVNGVHFENGEYGIADNVKMHHNGGIGLKFSGTCDHVDIIDCHIGSNQLDNVYIDVDPTTHEVNFIGDNVIHSSVTGYGINISAQTNSVIIGDQTVIFGNAAGDINDLSSNTYDARTKGMVKDIWQFKGCDSANPAAISGDGVTSSVIDVDGKTLTITPTSITRT